MDVDPAELTPKERYKLLISLAVPRPIAWTSTMGDDGSVNLAPFSFFNFFQVNPFPVLGLGVGTRGGEPKDTLRNIHQTGEFVVNIPDEATIEAMVATSGDHPYGVDEFDVVGVTKEPSKLVRPPRVAEAPAAFECRLLEARPLTRDARDAAEPHSTLVLGEVVHLRVRDGLLDAAGHVDVQTLAPVGRLGGPFYWRRGEVVRLPRPKVEDR